MYYCGVVEFIFDMIIANHILYKANRIFGSNKYINNYQSNCVS